MLELKYNERHLIEEGTLLDKALKVLKEYPSGIFRNPLGDVYRYGSSDTPIPDGSEYEIDIEEPIREVIFNIKEEIDCPTFGIKRTDNSVLVEWDWDGEEYLEGNEYYLDPSDERYQLEVPVNYIDRVVSHISSIFTTGMSYNSYEHEIRYSTGEVINDIIEMGNPVIEGSMSHILSKLKFLAKDLCTRTTIDCFEIISTKNEYILTTPLGSKNYPKELDDGITS